MSPQQLFLQPHNQPKPQFQSYQNIPARTNPSPLNCTFKPQISPNILHQLEQTSKRLHLDNSQWYIHDQRMKLFANLLVNLSGSSCQSLTVGTYRENFHYEKDKRKVTLICVTTVHVDFSNLAIPRWQNLKEIFIFEVPLITIEPIGFLDAPKLQTVRILFSLIISLRPLVKTSFTRLKSVQIYSICMFKQFDSLSRLSLMGQKCNKENKAGNNDLFLELKSMHALGTNFTHSLKLQSPHSHNINLVYDFGLKAINSSKDVWQVAFAKRRQLNTLMKKYKKDLIMSQNKGILEKEQGRAITALVKCVERLMLDD